MKQDSVLKMKRPHIVFVGKRNVGKSSLMNIVIGQELSIMSNEKGTTTDPVFKTMELSTLGPVILVDTPGIDDDSVLGTLRVNKTLQQIKQADIVVLVIDSSEGFDPEDIMFVKRVCRKECFHLIVFNKIDFLSVDQREEFLLEMKSQVSSIDGGSPVIGVSVRTGQGISTLKKMLAKIYVPCNESFVLDDVVSSGDVVLLVISSDTLTPKGRLILQQQMMIRVLLEKGITVTICREIDLSNMLDRLQKLPDLTIAESQVFREVAAKLPLKCPLSFFSIFLERY